MTSIQVWVGTRDGSELDAVGLCKMCGRPKPRRVAVGAPWRTFDGPNTSLVTFVLKLLGRTGERAGNCSDDECGGTTGGGSSGSASISFAFEVVLGFGL